MTGRVQSYRSPTAGNRPPAGRLPGELYVNYADMQFGVISAGGTPLDLGAIRFFSALANYAAGDHVVQAGSMYRAISAITPGAFNSTQWTQVSSVSGFLPLTGGVMTGTLTLANDPVGSLDAATKQFVVPTAGGTMTGPLVLSGDPVSNPNQAATKHYVDASIVGGVVANPNRLINGDMRICQINLAGGSAMVGGYTFMDRWSGSSNVSSTLVAAIGGQNMDGASLVPGFNNYMRMKNQSSGSYTSPSAADRWVGAQPIEGDAISDLLWGTSSALPVTLSFWARTSIAGSFSGSIQNGAYTRSYPFSYTLLANTWTKIVVTIPGDTAGTWVLSGNGIGLVVNFCFHANATFLGTAGSTSGWVTANYRGVTGSTVMVSSTVSGTWMDFTGVKLEVGNVATPWVKLPLQETLALCQRYQCKTYSQTEALSQNNTASSALSVYTGPTADATSHIGVTWTFPRTMRVPPTVTPCSPVYTTFVGWGQAYAQNAATVLTAGTGAIGDAAAFMNLSGVAVAARDTILFHASAYAEISVPN